MTTLEPVAATPTSDATGVRASGTSLIDDIVTLFIRNLRSVPGQPEAVVPPVFLSLFFYTVWVGSLQTVAQASTSQLDYKAFALVPAILLGSNAFSFATAFCVDLENGYFDRLLVSPMHRRALLLGPLLLDGVLGCAPALVLIGTASALGVRFDAGAGGIPALIMLVAAWTIAFNTIKYAIALKTANPAAVDQSFLLLFPFLFLTSSFMPRHILTGWFDNLARANPLTYLLEGMRSLVIGGWEWDQLAKAALVIGVVGAMGMALALTALRKRIEQT